MAPSIPSVVRLTPGFIAAPTRRPQPCARRAAIPARDRPGSAGPLDPRAPCAPTPAGRYPWGTWARRPGAASSLDSAVSSPGAGYGATRRDRLDVPLTGRDAGGARPAARPVV